MRKLLTLLFAFVALNVSAQTKEAKEKIIQQTNVEFLQGFAKEAKIRFESNKQKALELAKEKGWVIREDRDGKLIELISVTDKGDPIYYETYNVDAANSTRANTLHNGGSLGLNIEGQGMTAHVWDGGLARSTHQEYDGAGGTDRFSIGDGTSTLHYHAAHVTGTIMASGVDADAKGMAPQSYVIGYDWSNDVSEATTAAAGGMLVSNHSYGYGADAIPDAWFGQYGSDAVDWDGLMYNAPYYLMLVAAGNDGNDETSNAAPLDGNAAYDKLNGHATSKNNLVVANAQDAVIEGGELVSVLINTGSSEGPTDDYRIKPDIAGNGTQLYSTYESADDAYNSISGTSMATPNVTGTLLLLQQHYNDLNATFMRAATLKGLALHTADDAGASGPDAVFGWGLMNGKAAADAITNNGLESIIEERTLANGGSYSFDVVANGIDDLVASISWTDPAGTVNSGTNSSTPALVNDLDIRITKSATTYYPWKLTGVDSNTEGDNTVDPYEKIIIDNAVCGDTYTITINHKGTLSASQDYSIIVTGIKEASVDAGIVDVSPSVTSCEYSNNTPIEITIANQGGSALSNIDVAYEIRKADNSLVGNGTYTIASIAACSSDVTTVYGDMSENGETYNVSVSIVLAGDENSANNNYMGSFMPMNVDLTVPGSEYSTSFEAGSLAELGWSYEDVNGDGGQAVWYIYDDAGFANTGSGFAIMFAGAGDAQSDDWMYSPCLYLKAGQTYEVTYYSRQIQDKNESIGLYLGTSASAAAMTTTIEAAYEPGTAWGQRTPGSFTVPSDGVYYLGWHAYNMTDSYAPAIDDVTITNTSTATLPQVTTSEVTNIGATSADGGGNVTDGGSSDVTERGIVYSSSINPTTSDNKVTAGTAGTGTYSGLTMSSLTPGTTYYVRAYAINSSGTTYGDNESFTTLSAMNFVSATTVQNNSYVVDQGSTDQDILEIQIEMDGALSPFSATSFTFSTNGSTNASGDITSAKLYYSGTNGTFSTATQFGGAQSNPNGSFTITGTQELVDGTNYFWLAYDISASAGDGNAIDAECSSITVGSVRTPDVTAPAGNRMVYVDPCATPVAAFPYANDFAGNTLPDCWDNIDNDGGGQVWQFNNPGGRTFNSTTNANGFAILDSDNYGNGGSQNADLISPTYNLSNYTSITLSFEHYFRYYDNAVATLHYSVDNGSTWTQIDSWTGANEGTETNPAIFSQDLTNELEGEANVKFKWGYTGSWDWYWAIDDIEIDATLAGTPYTVTFDVTDAGDSHPIDGASISINSTTLTTDINGEATIDLIDGSYPYTVSKTGYDNEIGTVIVSGSAVSESVSLSESTYTLTFVVEDENSQAVENASIEVNSTTITTDVNGEATIDLVDGTYAYTVSKTGFNDATGSVTIAGTSLTENVTLTLPAYTVTFTVTDAGDSHALDGASIAINSTTLTTDLNGQATIDLVDGTYAYSVTRAGYDEASGSVTVSGAAIAENVLMNESTYTLTFIVVDESSSPVENASVDINSSTLSTDVNGEATIDLTNGTYSYAVSKAGFAEASGSVTISGSTVTENVTLTVPTYTVTFNVTDAGDSHAIDGAGISINSQTLTTNSSGQATIDLADGTYAYSANMAGYIEATGSVTLSGADVAEDVALTAIPPVTFDVTVNQDVTCNGGSDGEIEFSNATGGSGSGYEYSIDGGITWQSSAVFSGLSASSYVAQVKDGEGMMSDTESVTISEPDAIVFDVNITDVSTYGGSDGAIEIANANGGTGQYEYSMDEGSTWQAGNTFSGLSAGSYMIQVRDANLCVSAVSEETVNQPAPPAYTITFNVTDADDSHAIDGAGIDINSTTITTDASGIAIIDLEDGTYSYTVTKTNYEEASGSITVSGAAATVDVEMNPIVPITFDYDISNITCNGAADGSIAITNVQGGIGSDYQFSIDNGTTWQTSPVFTGLGANTYSLVVQDSESNMSDMQSATITEPTAVVLGTIDVTNVSTFGGNDGVITMANVSGGISPYEYSIDGGATWQTSNSFTELYAGSYTAVVADAASCLSDTENITITQPAEDSYTVTFTVYEGDHVIEGATINIDNETIVSNIDGFATIDLVNGTYSYTANLSGYSDITGEVIVNDADVNETISFVGIGELSANQVNIYPNPSNGVINVELEGEYTVTLINSIGNVIQTQEMKSAGVFEAPNAANGLYLLRIEKDGKVLTKPIIIKK